MVPRNMDHGARCDGIVLVDRPGGIAPGGRVRGAAARVRGAGLEDAGPWCAVL